jgi:ABC-type branched-subunit amino acid transport system permease subunit
MAARYALAGLALLCAALVPAIFPWLTVILILVVAQGLAVLGILVLLRAGQVSFGHGMFYAASAYAAAFVARALGGSEVLLLLAVALLTSAALGLVVGWFVVRYRYIFFAMLNLAFSMVLWSLLEKFYGITGGTYGLSIARPTLMGLALERGPFEIGLFYLALALAAVATLAVHRYLDSPVGQALGALRSNETRLEYLGVSPRRVLLLAYVVSAALAGLGGALQALIVGHITPDLAYWVRSGEFVFIAILGGAGSVLGPFLGALVYELVQTYAAAYAADVWQLILGSVLLLIILFAPQGLVGLYQEIGAVGGRRTPGRRALSQ